VVLGLALRVERAFRRDETGVLEHLAADEAAFVVAYS
jgi:hypothetical protein